MEMLLRLFSLDIKDGLIIISTLILVSCILQIRRLKKIIALETKKRLIPYLTLELDKKQHGIYAKNESFFLSKDIKIEDTEITLDDFGFKTNLILKFEGIDTLRPQERAQLKLKVFDKQGNFLSELTQKIILHLINTPFTVRIHLSNIENTKFCVTLTRRQQKFFIERIESFP